MMICRRLPPMLFFYSAVLALSSTPGSRAESPDFEDYATIEGETNGVPIYSLGNITYIYGVSPDFIPDAAIQEGNTWPRTKIKPKKSWEIESNYAGAYPAQPSVRTPYNDSQPLLPIHLIDGDRDTAWCSYGGQVPDVRPEWIRVDLPMETEIASIALVGSERFALGDAEGYVLSTSEYKKGWLTDWMGFHRWGGKALPRKLKVELSRDGAQWETVYETKDLREAPDGMTVVKFDPRPAKMVRVTGADFKRLLDKYTAYAWSIGELEVRDPTGRNIALVSRGAGVTVSSTSYLMNHDRLTQQLCFAPVLYDLGIKLINITADEGLQCWNYVERVKGELKVDPAFDAMVTDLNRCGIKVWMGLDVKANPIYLGRKQDWERVRWSEINNSYYDLSGWAWTDEALWEPYLRYVKFVVNHFKGRVVHYNVGSDWPGNPELVEVLRQTILEIDPNVTVYDDAWGPGYLHKRIDAGGDLAELKEFFPAARKAIKAKRAEGHDGLLNTSLMTWSLYPPGPAAEGEPDWRGDQDENGFVDYRYWCDTEMQRAKLVAQLFVGSAGLDMMALYCNPYFSSASIGQSLFRVPSPGAIIHPMQPDAGYYALRTLNTVLDGWKPADFPVQLDSERTLEHFTFAHPDGGKMLTAWIPGNTTDGLVETRCDVTIPNIKASLARGIDVLNGVEQPLDFHVSDNATKLPGILIKDYPVFIRIEQ